MSTITVIDDKPDISAIMREIRRLIEESGGSGPSLEEGQRLFDERLMALAYDARVDQELVNAITTGHPRWNVNDNFPMKSHRTGWPARLVIGLKRILRPLMRTLVNPLIHRQAEINRFTTVVLNDLLRQSIRMRIELDHLNRAIQRLGRKGINIPSRGAILDSMDSRFSIKRSRGRPENAKPGKRPGNRPPRKRSEVTNGNSGRSSRRPPGRPPAQRESRPSNRKPGKGTAR